MGERILGYRAPDACLVGTHIHHAAVDVAELFQTEESGAVRRIIELVRLRRRLASRRCRGLNRRLVSIRPTVVA